MTLAHTPSLRSSLSSGQNAKALESEIEALANLHVGLDRHMAAYDAAHRAATERLQQMIDRIDALLERTGQDVAS